MCNNSRGLVVFTSWCSNNEAESDFKLVGIMTERPERDLGWARFHEVCLCIGWGDFLDGFRSMGFD